METQIQKKKRKLSPTSAMHYFKLVVRSLMLIGALIIYIDNRLHNGGELYDRFREVPGLLQIIWVMFMIEMILRMFPANIESMGCQKLFKKNYIPNEKGSGKPVLLSGRMTLFVAFIWIVLNGAIGGLYYLGWIDEGILFLVSLAFSVCDMICILFFCPFQTWFMKNRCCTTCRIYNWDFAMMFTPLVFTDHFFTRSLLAVALLVLIQWEVTVYRHPERFSEETNKCISCANCTEKLCHHKKQLQSFWRKAKDRLL